MILLHHRNRLLDEERVLLAQLEALGAVSQADPSEAQGPKRKGRMAGVPRYMLPKRSLEPQLQPQPAWAATGSRQKEERLPVLSRPQLSGPKARSRPPRASSGEPPRWQKADLKPYMALGIPFPADPLLYRETRQMSRSASGPPMSSGRILKQLAASHRPENIESGHQGWMVQDSKKVSHLQPIYPSSMLSLPVAPMSAPSEMSSARSKFCVASEFENESVYDPLSGSAAQAAIQDIRRRASQFAQNKGSPPRTPGGRLIIQ